MLAMCLAAFPGGVRDALTMLQSIGAHIVYPDDTSSTIALHVVDAVAFRWPAYRTHRELMAVTRAFTGNKYADAIGIPQVDDPRVIEIELQRSQSVLDGARSVVGVVGGSAPVLMPLTSGVCFVLRHRAVSSSLRAAPL
jgi:hypothetical protein